MNEQLDEIEVMRARRAARMQEMQRRKKQQLMFRKCFKIFALTALLVLVLLLVGGKFVHNLSGTKNEKTEGSKAIDEQTVELTREELEENGNNIDDAFWEETNGTNVVNESEVKAPPKEYFAKTTPDTIQPINTVVSENAVFIDVETGDILAERNYKEGICPASMTKILTVLVAAEHVTDLDDTFTMTLEITDYGYVNDCSSAGFAKDETVTVRDLFYGTILPSGADAAVGLATYVAGDQESFVAMMNDKLKELGLSKTAHFTNCVGIYDEDHYCTVYDMAMILEAAIDNELCREVLSAHTYTTSKTEQHPDGIIISNWFLRRIEDKDTGGEVVCGKTGYVVQSGNCAASFGVDASGKEYICVTAESNSNWRCIKDHVDLYKQFAVET